MIYIYLRNFNSNFQLQLSSNASKGYVIELSYIIVFNSVTLISLYSDYFWNKFVILVPLSFVCKPIGKSEFARKLALMFITSNCMQLHNTVPPKPFPSVWSNLPSIIQVFLFLPMPKCTRWPWRGESVSAVPSATPGTNSLLQLSACCWFSETLRWQRSGNEITQLGYSLPLSGIQGTILSRQWKWFGSVMLEKCWNICPQQGTLSLAVEVLGREAPLPLCRQEIWDSLNLFSCWCWLRFWLYSQGIGCLDKHGTCCRRGSGMSYIISLAFRGETGLAFSLLYLLFHSIH